MIHFYINFNLITAVLDPVCEVLQPVVWGESVTLTCRMTYDWQSSARQFNPLPELNVSLSWNGVPDTTVKTTADPTVYRGTVETNMTINEITSNTIPSYTCTIQFDFLPSRTIFSTLYQYADNSVSSTCVTINTTLSRKLTVISDTDTFVRFVG